MTIKSDWTIRECFEGLRKDGQLGDILLTVAVQEEICELVDYFCFCCASTVFIGYLMFFAFDCREHGCYGQGCHLFTWYHCAFSLCWFSPYD